jgi:hypothetical protein
MPAPHRAAETLSVRLSRADADALEQMAYERRSTRGTLAREFLTAAIAAAATEGPTPVEIS